MSNSRLDVIGSTWTKCGAPICSKDRSAGSDLRRAATGGDPRRGQSWQWVSPAPRAGVRIDRMLPARFRLSLRPRCHAVPGRLDAAGVSPLAHGAVLASVLRSFPPFPTDVIGASPDKPGLYRHRDREMIKLPPELGKKLEHPRLLRHAQAQLARCLPALHGMVRRQYVLARSVAARGGGQEIRGVHGRRRCTCRARTSCATACRKRAASVPRIGRDSRHAAGAAVRLPRRPAERPERRRQEDRVNVDFTDLKKQYALVVENGVLNYFTKPAAGADASLTLSKLRSTRSSSRRRRSTRPLRRVR